jgi:hypothetical protein
MRGPVQALPEISFPTCPLHPTTPEILKLTCVEAIAACLFIVGMHGVRGWGVRVEG